MVKPFLENQISTGFQGRHLVVQQIDQQQEDHSDPHETPPLLKEHPQTLLNRPKLQKIRTTFLPPPPPKLDRNLHHRPINFPIGFLQNKLNEKQPDQEDRDADREGFDVA